MTVRFGPGIQERRKLLPGKKVWFVSGRTTLVIGQTTINRKSSRTNFNKKRKRTTYYLDSPCIQWDADYGLDIFLSKQEALMQFAERRALVLDIKVYLDLCDDYHLPKNLSKKVYEKYRKPNRIVLQKYSLVRWRRGFWRRDLKVLGRKKYL